MKIHEIGQYSTAKGDVLSLYMVEVPTHVGQEFGGPTVAGNVSYCMEAKVASNRLFISDWLAFAHMVNDVAGEAILDIHDVAEDPAYKAGLVVGVGMECPNCGCRVVDELVWIGEGEEFVFCNACKTEYVPGEQ